MKSHLLALGLILLVIAGIAALSSRRVAPQRASAVNSSRSAVSSSFEPIDPLPVIAVRGVRLGMSEEEVSRALGCQPMKRFPQASKDPNRSVATWGNQSWQLGCTFDSGHLTDMGGFGSDFAVGSKTYRYHSELSDLDRDLGRADRRGGVNGPTGWVRYPRYNLHVSHVDGKITGLQTYVVHHK